MSDKKNHTVLKVVGATATTAAVAYAGVSAYIFKEVFDLQSSSLYSGTGGTAHLIFTDSEKNEWFQHSDRYDDYVSSFDGLKLHALRICNHPDSHNWVLIDFGPGCYNRNLVDYLYEFDHDGYNILAIDNRGCGKSEGKYTTLGWSEHYDLISWVNYLTNVDPASKIALFGVSIGANAIMNAVGDYLPNNVVCAVEEGGFSDMKEVLRQGITKAMKADGKLVIPGINLLLKQILHFSIDDVNTARQLQQANIPMLFIQGTSTEFVSESMLFDNFYACGSDRELLTRDDIQTEYFNKLRAYIAKYFN